MFRGVSDCAQAALGFEPLAVLVEQRDECDGAGEHVGGQLGYGVEGGGTRRVDDREGAKRIQPQVLIVDDGIGDTRELRPGLPVRVSVSTA